MEIIKVHPEDSKSVFELFKKYDDDNSLTQKKMRLFQKYWQCSEDYLGLMIKDQEKVVAYFGLIFSDRNFNDSKTTFCNITSIIIEEAFRGQNITSKFIEHVKTLGNYTITAITPIPLLYSTYKKNGFIDLKDERALFWKYPILNTDSQIEFISDPDTILAILDETNKTIYLDHKNFNCIHLVLKKGNQNCYIILKKNIAQRRKFITNRWINYLDFGLRKISGLSFLNNLMESYEIHYTNNYNFLCDNISSFAKQFFKKYDVKLFSLRMEHYMAHKPKYPIMSNYCHSRQMYYSKTIKPEQLDTLYSEIFVLDM